MKRAFLFCVVFAIATISFAQQEKGSWTIYPKFGMNVANVTDLEDSNPRIGLAAGVGFQYQFSNRFGLSFDFLYSMQGDKTEGWTNYVKVKEIDKIDYLNIPILANVYLYKGLALKVGVQPGFNIVDKYKVTASGTSVTGDLSDFTDIKTFDFAIPVGISYEYRNVILDARYNIGVTNVVKDESNHNRVFQLTLGYKFKL